VKVVRLVRQYSDEPAEVQDEPLYAMTLQEVADELGVSHQAVKDVESRALRKLARSGRLRQIMDMWVKQ